MTQTTSPPNWQERCVGALHDDSNIKGFFGEYRWMSNFEECPIEYEGITYSSTEAAFQAAKTLNVGIRKNFVNLSPAAAKSLGRTVPLRTDWDNIRLNVMYEISMIKYSKPEYKAKLLATGEKFLEETNWWKDQFWGVSNGVGQNNLGKILMEIRKVLNDTSEA